MDPKKHPTIFIIDDDLEMRNSLSWLMESVQLKVEVFSNAIDFLKKYDPNRTGCILLDVRMPGFSGLELLDSLMALKNPLPVIVITGHGDIPMAIRAMKSGATDFILKPFNDQHLIEQIQKALLHNSGPATSLEAKSILTRFSKLTQREKEVMILVVEGKLNKQIAHKLNIAISTVEYHRSRMMRKMQAKNIAELVKMKVILPVETTGLQV